MYNPSYPTAAPGAPMPPSYGMVPPPVAAQAPPMPMPVPTAPMDPIAGYEGIRFGAVPAPSAPPSYFVSTGQQPAPADRPQVTSMSFLTEEDAKEALVEFANSDCCYGKEPATEIQINGLDSACAYHYILETYTERRDTEWAYEPYSGQHIDSPANGPAPAPWEVNAPANLARFQEGTVKKEVPHSASVRPCHDCGSTGRHNCTHCNVGRAPCSKCRRGQHLRVRGHLFDFETRDDDEGCDWCDEEAYERCAHCNGAGYKICDTCKGKTKLKCFIRLTVSMINHKAERLVDRTKNSILPPDVVRNAKGEQVVYQEEAPRIWPIPMFPPEPEIAAISAQLVQEHATTFTAERVHYQRHRVKVIPITKVACSWKGRDKKFYVYGQHNQVYFPDYYQQCCGCCCVIM